jgi:ribonuclease D
LPELRDLLRARLIQFGRFEWAEEEFGLTAQSRWTPPDGQELPYLRLKGAKALKPRELAVLRELYDWRESVARQTDKATFRILNNEPMLALARRQPTDLAALKAIPGISSDQAERRGDELLAAVRRGLEIPQADLPRVVRPPRRPPDQAYELRLDRLKATRNQLAERYQLAPGVLCPNGTLEAIARADPKTLVELAAIPGMRHWQLREIGSELLKAAT